MKDFRIVKAIAMTNKFTGETANVFFAVPVCEFGQVKLVKNACGVTPDSKGTFVYSQFTGWTTRKTLSEFEKKFKFEGWEFHKIIPNVKGMYVEYGTSIKW